MSNWITRKNTKAVDVGGVLVGNNNPISVQSMTNTNTCDVISTINQINDLQAAGADIVRVSVPGFDEAAAFKEIRKSVDIPLVADIHFDYKIALVYRVRNCSVGRTGFGGLLCGSPCPFFDQNIF